VNLTIDFDSLVIKEASKYTPSHFRVDTLKGVRMILITLKFVIASVTRVQRLSFSSDSSRYGERALCNFK